MLRKLKGLLESKQDGEIVGVASTENVDRDGEVIRQEGWDLNNFKQNPVILASHNYHDFPIGKATEIAIENGKLMFKMIFSQATTEAKQAYELVKEGILNTFSVGYIPREFDPADQNITTKAELLEISLVSVPANPQAVVVAKGMKDNALAEKLCKSWLADEKMKLEVEKLEKGKEEKENKGKEKKETVEKSGRELSEKNRATLKSAVESLKQIHDTLNELHISTGKEPEKTIKENKNASGGGNTQKTGEEGGKVEEKDVDVRLLQKATGHLQNLLCEIKKGGAKNA